MDLTVKEISTRLALDAERVVAHLLPTGRRLNGEWVTGDVSGSKGDSLKVHLAGEHVGRWRDWAEQTYRGDLVDLWAATKGIPLPDAVRAAKDWLGISNGSYAAQERRYAPAPKRDDIAPLNASGKAMHWLTTARKLDPAIVNRFRIQGDGKAIVFPCHAPSGRLINRSYRTLGAEKTVWQDKGCAPCLFGWHALDDRAYRDRTVLLCEGQIDAATWTQWGIPALSIPNGSGQTWIEHEWENLAAFDTLYISFDMDGSGMENAHKAINRLGRHRCLIVALPHKDANDCLLAGATAEDARQWIAEAKPLPLKNLVRAIDLEKRLMAALTPKPEGFTLPILRIARDEGYYPRPGEVTVWTGATSQGKSTFLNYFVLSLLVSGFPVLIASMEAKAETVLRKMMTSFVNRVPSQEDISQFLNEVGHLLIFADVVGYIEPKELLEMLQFSNRRYGVQHCVIDSLMRVNGLEEEYVEQGKFLNSLQEVCKTNDVHVHLVAHPRKMNDDAKPGKMDVKGSSLIPNNADNIVAVCRNPEKDRLRKDGKLTPALAFSMYDAEIRVEKQRETGWEGRFLLRFDPITFSYSPFGEAQVEKKTDPRLTD